MRRFLVLSLLAAAGIWIMVQPPGLGPLPLPLPPVSVPPLPRPLPKPPTAPLTGQIDRITIDKSARKMTVWRGETKLKTYRVALGFAPRGDKRRQGDGRTPEGSFRIDRRNDRSAYHLSLGIDYPRPADLTRARASGVSPGGDIFIHGQPNQRPDGEVLAGDWTAGCIAISDAEMREVFAATRIGTRVDILP